MKHYPKDRKIIAFDLSFSPGCAVWDGGKIHVYHGKFVLRKDRKTMPDDHIGKRHHNVMEWIMRITRNHVKGNQEWMMHYEIPMGYKGNRSSSTEQLIGILHTASFSHKCNIQGHSQQDIKKNFRMIWAQIHPDIPWRVRLAEIVTKKGNEKDLIKECAEEYFPCEVLTDDVADALFLMDYVLTQTNKQ